MIFILILFNLKLEKRAAKYKGKQTLDNLPSNIKDI